jgi:tetratricopeptide (TPR) repeat protein
MHDETDDEEVAFLLRSLDDLDAEREVGDLDEDDYATLRDGYTARAAEVLRAREEHRPAPPDEPPQRGRRHAVLWIVGVVAVAAVTGALLARSVGSRDGGTSLTGSGGSARERSADCLSTSFAKPAQGVTCYAAILADRPDDPEALTYQGWAWVRLGKTAKGSANFDRVVQLDPTYPDVHVFRASVRNAAGDYRGAQAELDALYALHPPDGIISTLQNMGLDREIAYHLLSPAVQPCWDDVEKAASLGSGKADQAKAGTLFAKGLECVSAAVAAHPDDLDALEAQGYLLGSSASSGTAAAAVLAGQARSALDRAVALAPKDPTARLLRAAVRNVNGDPAGAISDLDALAALGDQARPSPLYVLASPDEIRADATKSLGATSTTTSHP